MNADAQRQNVLFLKCYLSAVVGAEQGLGTEQYRAKWRPIESQINVQGV